MDLPKLPQNIIDQKLRNLNGWNQVEGRISKKYVFDNFPTAVLFVNKLVDPAEEMNHHPDIQINYNRVTVTLVTHDAGGLTDKDFILAKRINEL